MNIELLNAILKLETKVAVHRRETFITCEEKCWCWDAEALLIALERANNACTPTVGTLPQSEPLPTPKPGTGIEYLSTQPHSG